MLFIVHLLLCFCYLFIHLCICLFINQNMLKKKLMKVNGVEVDVIQYVFKLAIYLDI